MIPSHSLLNENYELTQDIWKLEAELFICKIVIAMQFISVIVFAVALLAVVV